MKTTKRFDNAVMKLYNAFHKGELELHNCSKCAVGNILDNNRDWFTYLRKSKEAYSMHINPLKENEICDMPKEILDFGYSAFELARIEHLFAENSDIGRDNFKGLCVVVKYLSELDNIPNPMDYTKLFEKENDKPKYQLVKL